MYQSYPAQMCHASLHKLPRQYFEKHVVKEAGKHIRSFASDVLSAVLACCWFCKIVLRPLNKMVEHSKALELLQVVHDILFSLGDNAPKLADLLDAILVVHHKMVLLLYGACAVKIKFHLLYHIPEKLRRFGKLNCFKTERMHVVPKNLAQHCCRTEQGQ